MGIVNEGILAMKRRPVPTGNKISMKEKAGRIDPISEPSRQIKIRIQSRRIVAFNKDLFGLSLLVGGKELVFCEFSRRPPFPLKKTAPVDNQLRFVFASVGAGGFEPPTSRTRTVRAIRTALRPEHCQENPNSRGIISHPHPFIKV